MSLLDTTVQVRRGGTYLTIASTSVERYLAKGFDVVDDGGNVIKQGAPNDVNALKIAYDKHIAEIKSLKSRISELEEQLKQASIVEEKEVVRKSTTKKSTKKSE